MKVTLVSIGKLKSHPVAKLVDDYSERLKHYASFEFLVVGDEAAGRARTKESDVLIVCHERGEQMSSVEFSKWIEEHQMRGTKRLIFVVGGPEGHSDKMKQRAALLLSFSKMTLPHEFCCVVMLEQLYRAFTLLKGEPYHK